MNAWTQEQGHTFSMHMGEAIDSEALVGSSPLHGHAGQPQLARVPHPCELRDLVSPSIRCKCMHAVDAYQLLVNAHSHREVKAAYECYAGQCVIPEHVLALQSHNF